MKKPRYRYATPNKHGAWFCNRADAERAAAEVGVGYIETETGRFRAGPLTTIEESFTVSGG